MSAPMQLERFAALADAYGGDLARWPQAEHEAARMLLQTSAEARIALDAARALDAGLALPAPEAPGPALRERLLQSRLNVRVGNAHPLRSGPRRGERPDGVGKPLPQGRRATGREGSSVLVSAVAGWREAWSWRLALPALALSLTLGIGMGLLVAPAAQADDGDEDVLALAQLDDDYAEFTEP